jgi:polysaccharide deacetylase family protein (PEP-CTERM system associated)
MTEVSRKAALSIDVEDWFHSENVKAVVPRETWEICESRVARNTERMLEILQDSGAHATFFVLGWVAERFPGLVPAIAAAGHELASHGYGHELVYKMSPAAFAADVERSRKLLEDQSGQAVRGYRAPCFSITDWAVDVLQEAGYAYDSSMVPALAHDRYGRLEAVDVRLPIMQLREGFHEICVSCLQVGGRGVPWGGGGYFRLVPYALWLRGVAAIQKSGKPYIFYIHPWEIDPGHPIPAGMGALNRFRQTVGLASGEARFAAIASDFEWNTVGGILDGWLAQQTTHEAPRLAAGMN